MLQFATELKKTHFGSIFGPFCLKKTSQNKYFDKIVLPVFSYYAKTSCKQSEKFKAC